MNALKQCLKTKVKSLVELAGNISDSDESCSTLSLTLFVMFTKINVHKPRLLVVVDSGSWHNNVRTVVVSSVTH